MKTNGVVITHENTLFRQGCETTQPGTSEPIHLWEWRNQNKHGQFEWLPVLRVATRIELDKVVAAMTPVKTNKIVEIRLTHTTEYGFAVEIDRINNRNGKVRFLSFERAAEIAYLLHQLVMAEEWHSDAEMLYDGISVRYWPAL